MGNTDSTSGDPQQQQRGGGAPSTPSSQHSGLPSDSDGEHVMPVAAPGSPFDASLVAQTPRATPRDRGIVQVSSTPASTPATSSKGPAAITLAKLGPGLNDSDIASVESVARIPSFLPVLPASVGQSYPSSTIEADSARKAPLPPGQGLPGHSDARASYVAARNWQLYSKKWTNRVTGTEYTLSSKLRDIENRASGLLKSFNDHTGEIKKFQAVWKEADKTRKLAHEAEASLLHLLECIETLEDVLPDDYKLPGVRQSVGNAIVEAGGGKKRAR